MRRFFITLVATLAMLAGALTAQAVTQHPVPRQAPHPVTVAVSQRGEASVRLTSFANAKTLAAQAFLAAQAQAHAAHAAHLIRMQHHAAYIALLAARARAAYLAQLAAQQAAAAPAPAYVAASAPASSAAPVSVAPSAAPVQRASGSYSYTGLEQLWTSAGGPASAAAQAATIAECESGGNPSAYNPSGATGVWQILGSVAGGNLYNAYDNARNAVAKFNASGGTFAQWVCQAAIVKGASAPVRATLMASVRPTLSAMAAHAVHLAHLRYLASRTHPAALVSVAGSSLGIRVLAEAETRAGDWYAWGGAGPGTFDCSGLVFWAAQQIGLSLPRDTYGMLGSYHLVRTYSPARGDLAFFGSGHVEIYASGHTTFGAQNSGTRVGFHTWGGWWAPTMFFQLR